MECFPHKKTDLLITAVAAAMGIFHVYTAFFGVLTALWQRGIHLTFGLIICYLSHSGIRKQGPEGFCPWLPLRPPWSAWPI